MGKNVFTTLTMAFLAAGMILGIVWPGETLADESILRVDRKWTMGVKSAVDSC